ncbi:protein of unknown function [Sporobacter termitidis DSM 10068]|uniref:DUF3786 domain-containing protein n=1 Tax=Sporobacter termitidis DSM 10068 TaxID=1123282 RepID=A0A1M5VBW3_9FIRM|nr:DUF3786 domain-containing protein [Sporobacter termitidis]SHH72717.1 protein of unknown function [Sporobacter termitidis DSM 10068]
MTLKQNNYAIAAENARLLFLKEDQEKLIQKFRLKADDTYLYLRFLDMTYRIERNSGHAQRTADNGGYIDDKDYNTVLSIYDYLCWSREDRQLSGRWISMQNMGHSFHTNLLEGDGSLYAKYAQAFSGYKEELDKVCKQLGGHKMSVGDVGYILPAFDELPVYFQFWDGDDEFPPTVAFLWDANTTQYIHYETTYYVLSMILDRMRELFTAAA